MIVGAAFCPHPPVLVPAVAAGAAGELDGLRAACDDAVGQLLAARPEVVVVLGAGPAAATYPDGAAGTLAGFGVQLRAGGPGQPVLPLSLTIGAWLLDRAGYAGPRAYGPVGNVPDAPAPRDVPHRTVVREGEAARRTALLVMGDGSARRDEKAPGALDPRAVGYDAALARVLATGDVAGLRARAADPLVADLMVGGAPAWAAAADLLTDVRVARARLLAEAAPYGVGYLVAVWTTDAGA